MDQVVKDRKRPREELIHTHQSLNGLTAYSQNGTENRAPLLNHAVGYRPNACTTIKNKSISQANGHDAHWTPDPVGHTSFVKAGTDQFLLQARRSSC